jgi:hypothetical protein
MKLPATLDKEAPGRSAVLIPVEPPKAIVRYVYYAFVFSIPFEQVAVDLGLPYTPSKLFGYMLLLVTFVTELDVVLLTRPKILWCFVSYLIVYALLGVPDATSLLDLLQFVALRSC